MAYLEKIKVPFYKGKHLCYWNYFNDDSFGVHPNTCCGQAAIYSALRTMLGDLSMDFKKFVSLNPPDMVWGSCGSSWQRIRDILVASGYNFGVKYGEGALRTALKTGPVIVCLDVGAAGWKKNGLHWVSVFGYTESTYYLTQWEGGEQNQCSRELFKKGWDTWLTRSASATSNACYIPRK